MLWRYRRFLTWLKLLWLELLILGSSQWVVGRQTLLTVHPIDIIATTTTLLVAHTFNCWSTSDIWIDATGTTRRLPSIASRYLFLLRFVRRVFYALILLLSKLLAIFLVAQSCAS